jgi:hypothetical protein
MLQTWIVLRSRGMPVARADYEPGCGLFPAGALAQVSDGSHAFRGYHAEHSGD